MKKMNHMYVQVLTTNLKGPAGAIIIHGGRICVIEGINRCDIDVRFLDGTKKHLKDLDRIALPTAEDLLTLTRGDYENLKISILTCKG